MTRIEALAAAVREEGADAMLLTGEVNLTYATKEVGLEGTCIIYADGRAQFLTDGRYIEYAAEKLEPQGFAVSLQPGACSRYDYPQALLESEGVQKLLYEDDVLTVAQFAALRKLTCTLMPIDTRITNLRACKEQEEIDCIVKAQRIAEKALSRLTGEFYTGITEREAAARLNYYMALGGSEKTSFDTIMLFGENTSKPHGIPTDRPLREGDPILVDFGAVYHGYHSDMTRTFAYGHATDEMRTVYSTVLKAQSAAREAARVGLLCSDMHHAAAEVINQAGYGEYFTHALGHSVGLEIHETPIAAPRCTKPLKTGYVITDEPGIYLAGKFGVRIEDMVAIDGSTPRVLTEFPKEFTVLPVRENTAKA